MALPGNNKSLGLGFWTLVGLAAPALLGVVWLASCAAENPQGLYANGAGLRLWVALGWLLQTVLVWELAGRQLPKRWRWLLLAFLALTDIRYLQFQPYWGSGLTSLFSVWGVQKYLKSVYAGRARQGWLAIGGAFVGVCFWLAPGTGLWLALGLGIFSLLHCFLHEREEKGVSYRLVSNREVLARWAKSWGLYWGLSVLAMAGAGMAALTGLGLWPDVWGQSLAFLKALPGRLGEDFGYFSGFHREFESVLRPEFAYRGWRWLFEGVSRCITACHLLAIGLLPVLGILGNGYILPNRFVYRLLRLEDEELLLYWVCGVALALSTFLGATSSHLVSVGGLPFMLGFLVLHRGVAKRPSAEGRLWAIIVVFLALLLVGEVCNFLLHT